MSGVAVTPGFGPEIDTETVTVDGETRERQRISVARSLAERMFARAPLAGYALWLDTGDLNHLYIAEAPVAAAGNALSFQGIRVPVDVSGNLVGKVQTASGFAWDSRKDALVTTWT